MDFKSEEDSNGIKKYLLMSRQDEDERSQGKPSSPTCANPAWQLTNRRQLRPSDCWPKQNDHTSYGRFRSISNHNQSCSDFIRYREQTWQKQQNPIRRACIAARQAPSSQTRKRWPIITRAIFIGGTIKPYAIECSNEEGYLVFAYVLGV